MNKVINASMAHNNEIPFGVRRQMNMIKSFAAEIHTNKLT